MISYGQISDIGRLRAFNQDVVYSQVISGGGAFNQSDMGLFIVADGLGLEPNGGLAARLVVETITLTLSRMLILPIAHKHLPIAEKLIEEALANAFDEANKAVSGKYGDGGAVATLAFVVDDKIYITHVGSTAAFLINHETIERLTRFHDVAEGMVEKGEYSSREEFLKYKGDTNGIYVAFGQSDSLFTIDFSVQLLNVKSVLLLCSSSLSETLSEAEILCTISESYHSQDACQRLVNAANAQNGKDNVSVILVANQFPFKTIEG